MTAKYKKASELRTLTDLALRQMQSEMQELKARETGLRENLAALTGEKSRQAATLTGPDNAAFIAGADFRWQHWVDQRRAAVNAELAQVLALTESCTQRMRLCFGRDQVAAALIDVVMKDQQIRRKRNTDYAS